MAVHVEEENEPRMGLARPSDWAEGRINGVDVAINGNSCHGGHRGNP